MKSLLDQTGCFTVTSIKGVKYVLILYSYDANVIFPEPLNSRTGKDILHKYITCHGYLTERRLMKKMYWLDNEASNSLKRYGQNQEVEIQLVPIGLH